MTDIAIDRLKVHLETGSEADRMALQAQLAQWIETGALAASLDQAVDLPGDVDLDLGRIDLSLDFSSVEVLRAQFRDELAHQVARVIERASRGGPVARTPSDEAAGGEVGSTLDTAALKTALRSDIGCRRVMVGLSDTDRAAILARVNPNAAPDAVRILQSYLDLHHDTPLIEGAGRPVDVTAWDAMARALSAGDAPLEVGFVRRWAQLNGLDGRNLAALVARRRGSERQTPLETPRPTITPQPDPLAVFTTDGAVPDMDPADLAAWLISQIREHGPDIGTRLVGLMETDASAPLRIVQTVPRDLLGEVLIAIAPHRAQLGLSWLGRVSSAQATQDTVRAMVLSWVGAAPGQSGTIAELDRKLALLRFVGVVPDRSEPASPAMSALTDVVQGAVAANHLRSDQIKAQVDALSETEAAQLVQMLHSAPYRQRLLAALDRAHLPRVLVSLGRPNAARAVDWVADVGTALPKHAPRDLIAAQDAILAASLPRDLAMDRAAARGLDVLAQCLKTTPDDIVQAVARHNSGQVETSVHDAILKACATRPLRRDPPPVENPQDGPEPASLTEPDLAGLVLVHPFLPRFFGMLGLTESGRFVSDIAVDRAIALLCVLAKGTPPDQTGPLPVANLLCGRPATFPPPDPITPIQSEVALIADLLGGICSAWPQLRNAQPATVRSEFLCRSGQLTRTPNGWALTVQPRPHDMLLRTLPWPIGLVRLRWMSEMVQVNWGVTP